MKKEDILKEFDKKFKSIKIANKYYFRTYFVYDSIKDWLSKKLDEFEEEIQEESYQEALDKMANLR